MVERTVRIGSTHGPQARPDKFFTQAASASGAAVTITKSGGMHVNGASILAVISQGIDHCDEITLTVDRSDEQTVLDELVELPLTDHEE